MPQFRKLAPDDVQGIENKGKEPRKLTEELYHSFDHLIYLLMIHCRSEA